MNIACVLASWRPDEPAGMERSTAGLLTGLRALGHRAFVITAAPQPPSADTISLRSLPVRFPADDQTLRTAITDTGDRLTAELAAILRSHAVDVMYYLDALWGLGRVAPITHPAQRVLGMHVVGHHDDLTAAFDRRPDAVIAPSDIVFAEAARRGYPADRWRVVPNSLLIADPPAPEKHRRAELRRTGPVRALARLGPEKGIDRLLAAANGLDRLVDIAVATAAFEPEAGSQARLLDHYRAHAGPNVTIRARPPEVIVVFDGQHGAAARRDTDANYKANRPAEGSAPLPILALADVQRGLDACDTAWVEIDNAEADDVIATLIAGAGDREVLILSGDRDSYQLVTDHVHVLNTAMHPGKRHIGPEQVLDRYHVTPTQWACYRALTGDPADNLPGIPGVGAGTAAKLLAGGLTLDDLPGSGRPPAPKAPQSPPPGPSSSHGAASSACAPTSCCPSNPPASPPGPAHTRRSGRTPQPVVTPHHQPPASVLAVMAHPDDAELWAGGTLAHHARTGATVTIALLSHDPIRDAEAATGAAILGATLHLLDHLTTQALANLLDQVRPDVVITHPVDDVHPDHRHTATTVLDALPDIVIATGHSRRLNTCDTYNSLTLHGPLHAPVIVDITDTFATKMRALATHASQPITAHFGPMAEHLAQLWGARIGTGHAEAFTPIPSSAASPPSNSSDPGEPSSARSYAYASPGRLLSASRC